MYRIKDGALQVLLAHPGGPYFAKKDDGAWTIPKGEPDGDEDLLLAAQREFKEETGITAFGPFIPLRPIKQKGGKVVHAWAFAGDCDPEAITSNTFTLEWPPKSGKQREFPEIDRGMVRSGGGPNEDQGRAGWVDRGVGWDTSDQLTRQLMILQFGRACWSRFTASSEIGNFS